MRIARYKFLTRKRNSTLDNVHIRDRIPKLFHTLISVVKHVFFLIIWIDIQGKYQNPELNPCINDPINDRLHDEIFAEASQNQHSSTFLFSALK